MNEIIKKIEAEQLKENAPEFHVGDTVKVYAKIKEGNRERIQVFEGTVLKRQGGGARETFTVRKTSNGKKGKTELLKKTRGKSCEGKRISKIVDHERDNYRTVYCPFLNIKG